MADLPKTPADWRAKIDTLNERLVEAEQGLAKAKANAARNVLEDGEDASRELTTWRDRIDAVQTALGEAQRGLRDAEAAVTAKQRAKARQRADEAARQRHLAAIDFDTAIEAAEQALQRFHAAGLEHRQHLIDAGLNPPSHAKMNAGEAVRGAVAAGAYGLSGVLDCRPYSRDSRVPLASHAARQTPWKQEVAA